MTTTNTVYDTLYNNIKNRFTVEDNNGKEYTLGDYMLMKANAKKENATLPVAVTRPEMRAVSAIINYVNDKLTVKTPPEKDKTIKSFPFRTSIAAFLSSALMCTLVLTYGIVALSSVSDSTTPSAAVEVEDTEENTETPSNK